MQHENVLKVIDELGEILTNKDNKIKLQQYQIKELEKKISNIETYIKKIEKGAWIPFRVNASNNKINVSRETLREELW